MDTPTLPTLADVLALPAMQRSHPRVLTGRDELNRRVRWVHVSEVSNIATLLEGGELILTTGIALPDSAADLARYVADLSAAGVAALAVEVGRRYRVAVPTDLVEAAADLGLPLIQLDRVTPFVAITQAVHTMILDARMQELIASDVAHRAFTELTVSGQGPQQIVDLVAEMSGRSVVYENAAHHALTFSCAPGTDPSAMLAQWEALPPSPDADAAYFAVQVMAPSGGTWGRLTMLSNEPLTRRQHMLLERGATALVINGLTDRELDSLERHSHQTVLTGLALASRPPAELAAEAHALGIPLEQRSLTGVIIRPVGEYVSKRGTPVLLRDLARAASGVLQAKGVPALVGPLDAERVAVLLASEHGAHHDALDEMSERLHQIAARRSDARLIIGVGSAVRGPERAKSTLREAMGVVDGALTLPARRGYFQVPDLHLRGLMFALRDEPALHDYVERELDPLVAHDAATGSRLVDFLTMYCRHGGNKSATANALFISRPSLYDRITKIERILDVDLSNPEIILDYHLALIAQEMIENPALAIGGQTARRPTIHAPT